MNGAKPAEISVEQRLRRACAELDARVVAGDACCAEEYLSSDRALASNSEFALELIYTEFAARERCGHSLRIEEWYHRFPQWRDELARLIELHELVRDTDGPSQEKTTFLSSNNLVGITDAKNLAGQQLGQYQLLEEIGHGGMGIVYKAWQLGLGRTVAIKLILALQTTSSQRARFRKEAETVARLHHPNIVQVHEVGEQKGCS